MKLRKFWSVGGCVPGAPPLDPPLLVTTPPPGGKINDHHHPPPGNYGQWVDGTYLIVIYRWHHHEISFLWEKSAWQQSRAQFRHYYHPPSGSDLTTTTTSPNLVITANGWAVHIQGWIQDFYKRGCQPPMGGASI